MNILARPPRIATHANSLSAVTVPTRIRCLKVCASVHARWCLDVRYGCKQDATALLQEWVATIGSRAGLSQHNTRLSSGCLGVPESRLEMEVTLDSMADWEIFLAAIPFEEHKAWTQRMQNLVVDGTPVWQVHRSVPLKAPAGGKLQSLSSSMLLGNALDQERGLQPFGPSTFSKPDDQYTNKQLVITDQIGLEDIAAWNNMSKQQQQQEEGSLLAPAAPSTPAANDPSADDNGPRDWKGEPMRINPGDKLPFKFL